MKKIKAVIFDWDETLCMVGYDSCRRALQKAKIKIDEKKLKENWGLTLKIFAQNVCPGLDSDQLKKLFNEAESQVPKDKVLVPGMAGVLKRLESDGLYVGVLTNSSWARMKRHMKKANFSWHDSGIKSMVMCGNTGIRKPNIRAFSAMEECIGAVNITKEECIYVGDSIIDIQFARNLNIPIIIPLGFSHFNKEDCSQIKYDELYFIKNIKCLPMFIKEMF